MFLFSCLCLWVGKTICARPNEDGLINGVVATKILRTRCQYQEAVGAAMTIADIPKTNIIDLCTLAVADLIAREFFAAGPTHQVNAVFPYSFLPCHSGVVVCSLNVLFHAFEFFGLSACFPTPTSRHPCQARPHHSTALVDSSELVTAGATCPSLPGQAREMPNTTHHNTPQHTTTHHNTPQHTTTHHNTPQHTTTHHNTPQHTTTHHNTPQHTTTHHNTTTPQHHNTTPPHHHTTTPPHHHTTTPPHHHTTTPPHHHTTTTPQHHNTTTPQHHNTTTPQHHNTTLPHYHITTLPHHHTTTSPQHHSTTAPQHTPHALCIRRILCFIQAFSTARSHTSSLVPVAWSAPLARTWFSHAALHASADLFIEWLLFVGDICVAPLLLGLHRTWSCLTAVQASVLSSVGGWCWLDRVETT